MNIRDSKERWLTPEGRSLAAEVAFRLLHGATFEGLGLGHHEGLIDLRGYSLPAPSVIARTVVRGMEALELDGVLSLRPVRWANLDLSYSVLPNLRFFGGSIVDCRFDAARCIDWRLWGVRVERVSFLRADLGGAVMGSGAPPNSWTDVTFDRGNLKNAVVNMATFERCSFSNSVINGLFFEGCVFNDVVFAGRMKDVLFENRPQADRPDPGPLRNVDFEEADLLHAEWRGCRFDGVRWPDDPGLIVHTRAVEVGRTQLALLENVKGPAADQVRRVIDLRRYGPEGSHGVFSRRDWQSWEVDGAAALAESTLVEAMQLVGSEKLN